MAKHPPVVVIPNLNGGQALLDALSSLHKQTLRPHIIVVDNASSDGSAERAQKKFPDIEVIWHKRNKGYAGGVNPGFERAIERGATYVAPFNDDAAADPKWLKHLVGFLDTHPNHGAVCCKVLKDDGKHLDSTGDFLTVWGLPYPRGRDELDSGQYDDGADVFAASGAASLFRVATLKKVGLFDEAFFAYYEDVDLGFRMQNQGWKVGYEPRAIVHHAVGMTSGRIKGFTTYQTLKNLPLLVWKNVPFLLLFRILPRFYFAYILFFFRAFLRGHGISAIRGVCMSAFWLGWKLPEITLLDLKRKLNSRQVWSLLVHDLPPNAKTLRSLRTKWHKLTFRGSKDD
ncbi:glycosyl transferase [Candidatus Saccharibacteria bacterium]|nr:MAG: glycosyl transferase [Candidatus Saccharibacteria bacterium]PID99172.1 MAG: glycosyl transferase [Candidatus Saccharibacteria bacterium]